MNMLLNLSDCFISSSERGLCCFTIFEVLEFSSVGLVFTIKSQLFIFKRENCSYSVVIAVDGKPEKYTIPFFLAPLHALLSCLESVSFLEWVSCLFYTCIRPCIGQIQMISAINNLIFLGNLPLFRSKECACGTQYHLLSFC